MEAFNTVPTPLWEFVEQGMIQENQCSIWNTDMRDFFQQYQPKYTDQHIVSGALANEGHGLIGETFSWLWECRNP